MINQLNVTSLPKESKMYFKNRLKIFSTNIKSKMCSNEIQMKIITRLVNTFYLNLLF